MEREKERKNLFDKLNQAVLDMTEQVFGQKGREFVENTQYQIKEFNISAIRAWVNFTDKFLEDSKLIDNEIVKKTSSTVKDLLKQLKILEEDSEEDF
ncbi:MAG: hypothetical protein K9W44_12670 [Candidatus Lokiarchaeota archaeon]|nr:hypothetical protein [Candidatus Harpocratesius repetitus]